VNPGKQEGGGRKKIKKSVSFLFEVSCSQRRTKHVDAAAVVEFRLVSLDAVGANRVVSRVGAPGAGMPLPAPANRDSTVAEPTHARK